MPLNHAEAVDGSIFTDDGFQNHDALCSRFDRERRIHRFNLINQSCGLNAAALSNRLGIDHGWWRRRWQRSRTRTFRHETDIWDESRRPAGSFNGTKGWHVDRVSDRTGSPI